MLNMRPVAPEVCDVHALARIADGEVLLCGFGTVIPSSSSLRRHGFGPPDRETTGMAALPQPAAAPAQRKHGRDRADHADRERRIDFRDRSEAAIAALGRGLPARIHGLRICMTRMPAATEPDRAAAGGLVGKALWSALDFGSQQATALLVFLVVGNISVGARRGRRPDHRPAWRHAHDGAAARWLRGCDHPAPAARARAFRYRLRLLAGLGLLAGLALWLVSPAYAALFHAPALRRDPAAARHRAAPAGLAVAYQALLQRALRFRALALRSLVAQSAGFALALAMARAGAGIDALIGYFLVVRGLDAPSCSASWRGACRGSRCAACWPTSSASASTDLATRSSASS